MQSQETARQAGGRAIREALAQAAGRELVTVYVEGPDGSLTVAGAFAVEEMPARSRERFQ